MGRNRASIFFVVLVVAMALLVSGCAGIMAGKSGEEDPRVTHLTQKVRSLNQGLETVKGTGHIILVNGGTRQRYKIAWAARLPDKIRLTILETGIPVETIVADGETVTFVSHTGRHRRHTIKDPNPSLKSMVELPVRIREIISLLSGKLPLEPFDQERLSATDKTGKTELLLSRKWRGTTARVQFDAGDRIVEFEPVGRDGNTVYQVSRSDFKFFGSYLVPGATLVKDPSGRTMTLQISGFYPDLPIKASVFTLTETE
jgi:outer membrane lipoprotein-sorting protein